MHPIDDYETLRRGHEERLRRAAYERIARKARVEQSRSKNTQNRSEVLQSASDQAGMHSDEESS